MKHNDSVNQLESTVETCKIDIVEIWEIKKKSEERILCRKTKIHCNRQCNRKYKKVGFLIHKNLNNELIPFEEIK